MLNKVVVMKHRSTCCLLLSFNIITIIWTVQVFIGGVMISVLATIVVDRGFEPRPNKAESYKTGICCFFTNHAVLKRKSKCFLTRNQNNVSEWNDTSTNGLLFQHYTNPAKHVGLVQSAHSQHQFIECNLF